MSRLLNVLLALDCLVLSLLTLGGSYPFESISSSAFRAEKLGMRWGAARPVIDWIFLHLFKQANHCEGAYRSASTNLPPDERAP